jgi:glyoxylase-like metal-dependent hydrolase (beta-lactamase superfamily II)/8-oxo-dGTP pyrophosphatase MutT (NUDIX family)
VSQLPKGIPPAEVPVPKDSALGIVVRRNDSGSWEFLLGKRSRRSGFLPGYLAFPGGRLDQEDRPEEDGALERCASREIVEETGISIPPDEWRDAGERITPPFYKVRFRTRFFVAPAPEPCELPDPPPSPQEIESLVFRTAGSVVRAWGEGDALVPPPVLAVLRALDERHPGSIEELVSTARAVNEAEQRCPRIEFAPGIWMLPVKTDTLPPATHTNVWMPGAERFVVVDPGSDDPGELARLVEVIRRREKTGSSPESIVLTHHHRDHVAGAFLLARELGLPVRAHRETIELCERGDDGVEIIEWEDGDVIDLGGASLVAIHTPGHAPGHLVLHLPERRALLAGDLVSGLSTILIDPDEGDMGRYIDSLRRASEIDCRTVLASHGPPLPSKVIERTLAHRLERESRVRSAVEAGPRPLAEIAEEAYEDTPGTIAALAEMQALAHLIGLEKQGKVVRLSGSRFAAKDGDRER